MVSKTQPEKEKTPAPEASGLPGYELTLILNPDTPEEKSEARLNGISQFITGHGGTIAKVDRWGKRRLAYPIKHMNEGSYVIYYFNLSTARSRELEANLRIYEDVLRFLLIRQS